MEGIDKEMQMNIFFKQKKVKDERLGPGKQEKNTKKDEIGRRKETKKFEMMKGGQEDERKNATNRMTNST